MQDNHIRITINLSGNNAVSFATKYGWMEKQSLVIDAIDINDAAETATLVLRDLDVRPFENCSSNEDFVLEANVIISDMITRISEVELVSNEYREIGIETNAMCISIKFEGTYQVHFT